MNRIALVALALAAAASPAVSNHTPSGMMERAQSHVRALDREIDSVRHPHLRAQLEDRVQRIERLLNRIEASGALEPPRGPHPRPHRPASLSYDDLRVLMARERFDGDKLRVLQRSVGQARLTTDEARALAAELTFDQHREQALIALYPRVVDPHRFALALDVLSFSSSRRRVARTLGV